MRCFSLTLLLTACAAPHTFGDVKGSGSHGFLIHHTSTIDAPRDRVFAALVKQIDQWWHKSHTYSGDASKLSIDTKSGGAFLERLPNGGFVRHLDVVYYAPGKALRMTGGLGPLQEIGCHGALTVKLRDVDGQTELTMTYGVTGFFPDGMDQLAAPVDRVLTEQLKRLRNFVETGSPEDRAR